MDVQTATIGRRGFAMLNRRAWMFTLLGLLASSIGLRAAESPEVLRYVPKQAGFVLVVENPRDVVETVLRLRAVQDATAFPAIREVLDGTAVRRAFQYLKYVERETGEQWPALLHKTAGGGIAFAVGYTPVGDADANLLVIRGKDEAATAKVFDLILKAAEEERARQGNSQPVKRARKGEADVVEIDKDLIVARRGALTFVSNKSKGITAAMDLASGSGKVESLQTRPTISEALTLLPPNPLAWFWLDFAALKEKKETKDFLETTRKEPTQLLVIGSTVDCLARSDFVAGALVREKDGLRFTVRLPAGRDGFPPEFALHVPPEGKPGSLPLLEPPGVLYSQSFHLDLATLWTEREKLLNPEVRKAFEKGEKDISKFIPGAQIGETLEKWGAYHRFVIVNLDSPPYKKEPGQKLPGFGYATSMKEPKFGKAVEGMIRSGGLLVSLSQGLKLVEETHDGVKLFGYRFPENRKLDGDDADLRYNFEPTFAIVDDQFLAGSTKEVVKKLIAEVRRTAKEPTSESVWRAKAYAAAGAHALAAAPEATITDAMLRQAITLAEAKLQVEQIGDYLKTLGTFTIDIDEAPKRYSFDLVWKFK